MHSTIINIVEYILNYFASKLERKVIYMSKNEFVCDCNIIHEDLVNDAIKHMHGEDFFCKLAEFFKILRRHNKNKNPFCT